ncbi:MAG: PTS sugar transporter subunit IIC [Erysipelotrichaceae bacterium]|nr:PTS sugar transporter subunit IIC [Erysipelotrichaceae bacterium]
MQLGSAILLSALCAFFGWTNYGFVNLGTTRPIICGTLVGIILGDAYTGIVIGGTLQLVYLGVQGIGAAIPVNSTTATTVTTALTIATGVPMETAIALAVPVSVMGQLGRMAAWTINAPIMHIADKLAEEAEYKKMKMLQLLGSLVFYVTEFIPVFLCIYFGSQFVTSLNENMPPLVSDWLSKATGMLPALGFGMLLALMYKPKFLPFFIIGFVMSAVFKGSLLAIALLGAAMALAIFFYGPSSQGKTRRKAGA